MAVKRVCLFTGNANPALALEIAKVLSTPLGEARVSRFSDGETFCEIRENVRGLETYVIQPTCSPVNDNLMELLIVIDALRQQAARGLGWPSRHGSRRRTVALCPWNHRTARARGSPYDFRFPHTLPTEAHHAAGDIPARPAALR